MSFVPLFCSPLVWSIIYVVDCEIVIEELESEVLFSML